MAANAVDAGAVPNSSTATPSGSRRQPELDALRGALLIWMTLTHLPTAASAYSNQAFGFVSAAEGFIFLSALLCGRVFGRKLQSSGAREVRLRLWTRASRLYGYHLALLAVAFSVVARIAIHTQQPSLQGLVDYYLAHPLRGVAASALLIYQPPLLDILPMYIVFLVLTPIALVLGARCGWKTILIPSLAIWVAAQFGSKAGFYWAAVRVTHFDIPFAALGAFDIFAWQFLWAVGLWIGSGQPALMKMRARPSFAFWCALVLAALFCCARHSFLWDVMNNPPWAILTDKWHLGPLRLLNFTCVAILFGTFQPALAKWARNGPLVMLGQSSLEVFCAHLLVCFAALALVADRPSVSAWTQASIIVIGIGVLFAVAKVFSKQQKHSSKPPRED